MADISDVTAYLASQAALAVYPTGSSNPSIAPVMPGFSAPMDVRIFEGWPMPDQIDMDVAGEIMNTATPPVRIPRANGPAANVSIYPLQGVNTTPFQVQNNTYVITPPSYGMTLTSIVGSVITIAGQPNAAEYLTIVADRQFVYSSGGANTTAILAALATAAQVNYPTATSTATTLTIPYGYQIEVRIGGQATLGIATHRQCKSVMVTTWAPTHGARNTIAAAIDNFLKRTLTAAMPDTSIAKIIYSHDSQTDEMETMTIYRRDLFYDVEYATVWEFPGYVVTAPVVNLAAGNWGIPAFTPPTINVPG